MKKQKPEELVIDEGEFEAMMKRALGAKTPSPDAARNKAKAPRKRSKRTTKDAG